jgi:hypothetical protein
MYEKTAREATFAAVLIWFCRTDKVLDPGLQSQPNELDLCKAEDVISCDIVERTVPIEVQDESESGYDSMPAKITFPNSAMIIEWMTSFTTRKTVQRRSAHSRSIIS